MQYKVVTIKGLNLTKDKPTCGILIDTAKGELWFNGWRTPRMEQLNKGETITVWLYQEEYNGAMQNKFKLPSIDHLLQQMTQQMGWTPSEKAAPVAPKPVAAKPPVDDTNDIRVEDIPF